MESAARIADIVASSVTAKRRQLEIRFILRLVWEITDDRNKWLEMLSGQKLKIYKK